MSQLNTFVIADWEHFFTVVNVEDGWITPVLASIEGISVEEAFWRPAGEVASIAEIILHTTGWLEHSLRQVLGTTDIENVDWPEPPMPSAETWTGIVDRLSLTVADLNRALHNLEIQDLYGVPVGAEMRRSTMLTNILVHTAYHAGQVVKLRQAFQAIHAKEVAVW